MLPIGAMSARKYRPLRMLAVAAFAGGAHAASAAPLTIACESEDRMMVGWTAPLTISYSGGASGDVTVKSEHVTFSLPAKQTETAATDGTARTAIIGSGETSSVMPDPQALKACMDGALRPEQANDEDLQFQALRECAAKVATSTSPIGVHASITIILGGLVPTDDPKGVIVAIKRGYAGAGTAASANVIIRTSPDNCKVAGQ